MRKFSKRGQVAFEYLVIMGFVAMILTITIGVALIQSGNVNSQLKTTQLTNCVNKIITTAEQVFYAGEPSKSTITCYLPDNVENLEIIDNAIYVTFQTTTGENKIAFESNVPINGTIPFTKEINKIEITAKENYAEIARV